VEETAEVAQEGGLVGKGFVVCAYYQLSRLSVGLVCVDGTARTGLVNLDNPENLPHRSFRRQNGVHEDRTQFRGCYWARLFD
jgi:hypothetical protein